MRPETSVLVATMARSAHPARFPADDARLFSECRVELLRHVGGSRSPANPYAPSENLPGMDESKLTGTPPLPGFVSRFFGRHTGPSSPRVMHRVTHLLLLIRFESHGKFNCLRVLLVKAAPSEFRQEARPQNVPSTKRKPLRRRLSHRSRQSTVPASRRPRRRPGRR